MRMERQKTTIEDKNSIYSTTYSRINQDKITIVLKLEIRRNKEPHTTLKQQLRHLILNNQVWLAINIVSIKNSQYKVVVLRVIRQIKQRNEEISAKGSKIHSGREIEETQSNKSS